MQDTGRSQWTSSAQAPCAAAASFNLPIFFSRGSGRREARPGATTARYGRDSAAIGQGTKGRAKRRSAGARALGPGRAAGRLAGGFLWAATVAAKGRHNLVPPETGRGCEPKLEFQARLQLRRSRDTTNFKIAGFNKIKCIIVILNIIRVLRQQPKFSCSHSVANTAVAVTFSMSSTRFSRGDWADRFYCGHQRSSSSSGWGLGICPLGHVR